MKIGIDISQVVYEGTGVGRYVRQLVSALLNLDKNNEYVLIGFSLRRRQKVQDFFREVSLNHKNVRLVSWPVPPAMLDFFWNRLHLLPIEWLIGKVDVFWSSDWTQPPLSNAGGVTTIHDLSFLKFPESFDKKIIEVQKRRLKLVKKECRMILCDSESTKKDVVELLHIPENRLQVIYPGI